MNPTFQDEPPVSHDEEQTEVPTPKRTVKKKPAPAKKTEKPEEEEESYEHEPGQIVDLPSKGKLGYPGSISYRDILGADEEVLKTTTGKNYARTVNRVLKSICNDAEFFDDLYVGDRDYILCHIWANTYDNIKRFEVTCPHCGTKGEKTIDMFEIETIDVKDNFTSRFAIPVKGTDEKIYVRPVTVRDDNNAEKFMADNPNTKYTSEFVRYALALEFDRPMKTSERLDYLSKMTAKDIGRIKQYHQYFAFGLDTRYEYTCVNSECGEVTRGHIPFHPSDFIDPDVRTDFEQLLRDQ